MKDRRTDEHYGIKHTAAFDLGWDGNSRERGQLRFNGLGKAAALPDVRGKKQSWNGLSIPAMAMIPQTPLELLETAYAKIRSKLTAELLDRIKAESAFLFERVVVELLLRMGTVAAGRMLVRLSR